MLGPLFSIAEPFDVPYVWTWDTTSYPWTINLKAPSTAITAEVRYGKNLAEIERTVDPSNIVNRLYPLGYGEGVNQLDITKVNGGRAYIENTASIAEYGLGQYVWVDRRFEDAASLLASAKAFLEEWSIPKVTYRIRAVDLSSLTGVSIDKLTVGKVIRVTDPDIGTFNARIVSERKPNMIEEPYNIELEIVNTRSNIGTTLADIERRQEINEVYSQGATNMIIYPYEDNADAQHPAVIRFKLPEEMVRINKLELTYETSAFRAYSRAIEGGGALVTSTAAGGALIKSTSAGGAVVKSTSSGGGTTATSSSGGGVAKSTASGGGSSQTSSSAGSASTNSGNISFSNQSLTTEMPILGVPYEDHIHVTYLGNKLDHNHTITLGSHNHTVTIPSHTHSFDVPNHSHTVNIPNHTHEIDIPNHSHEIDIPAHQHDITLPDHTHGIDYGIFKLSHTPSKVTIKVDGKAIPHTATSGDSLDLIPYLALDSENRVQRGWHTVEITPNERGRINAQLMVQFFMQSRGGVDA